MAIRPLFQKRNRVRFERMNEAEFDDGVHRFVDRRRNDDQMSRFTFPKAEPIAR